MREVRTRCVFHAVMPCEAKQSRSRNPGREFPDRRSRQGGLGMTALRCTRKAAWAASFSEREGSMNTLLAASAAFFLLHMLPATPLRPRLIALLASRSMPAIFSIASAAAIWWMVSSFNAAPYGDKLWVAPAAWLWLKAALVLFAFILIVGGLATPNPSAPGGDKVLEKGNAAAGIFAITRHPLMWGIAIWAIAHMISQANSARLRVFRQASRRPRSSEASCSKGASGRSLPAGRRSRPRPRSCPSPQSLMAARRLA